MTMRCFYFLVCLALASGFAYADDILTAGEAPSDGSAVLVGQDNPESSGDVQAPDKRNISGTGSDHDNISEGSIMPGHDIPQDEGEITENE